MTEQVLVIPTQKFHDLGYFQGFNYGVNEDYISQLLDPEITSYKPRDEMEKNPNFKQLIPYVIFRCLDSTDSEIFCYVRAKSGGEKRLHNFRSFGIGGHISLTDKKRKSADPYRAGLKREIREEVQVGSSTSEQIIGVLNDDSNEVGRVHLGIVHIIDLDKPRVRAKETSIQSGKFYRVSECLKDMESFENWSRIILQTYGIFL